MSAPARCGDTAKRTRDLQGTTSSQNARRDFLRGCPREHSNIYEYRVTVAGGGVCPLARFVTRLGRPLELDRFTPVLAKQQTSLRNGAERNKVY
jgi:hypothetical protein